MTDDPTRDFVAMMQLEPHGPDVFVGTGPRYPWGGLYGGQIVAQALRAAANTVEPQFQAHSLHAYFIRRGDHAEPVRYEVDRVRNGRSFVTRNVVARQAVGAILSLSASFQIDDETPEVQRDRAPEVPGPDTLPPVSWSPMYDRRSFPLGDPPGSARGWLRLYDGVEDPVLSTCALAYMSDDLPTDAAVALHPDRAAPGTAPEEYSFAAFSLDHAMWFHRATEPSQWHLHDFSCRNLISSRGVSQGRIYSDAGTHVATVTQEVLLRPRR